jgi:GT2 family glycosyltransferase
MDKQIDISIIIVSYNTAGLLNDCLKSVQKSLVQSEITFEIIVIDNNSTDSTRDMLATSFSTVKTILNSENVGFGRANNQGFLIAQGAYILMLNSDTIVLGNSIEKLYRFCVQKGQVFVGAKLFNADRTPQTSCGPFLNLPVVFAALFLKGDLLGITRFSPNKPKRIDWVSGACIMVPKQILTDDLRFDENIHMYMEEIDLLFRAKKKGIKTYFTPSARIIHYGAASSKDKRKGPVLNIYRGLLYFYKKHYSGISLFILIILLRLKAGFAYLLGQLIGNEYLKETYGEAYKLV